MAEQISETGAYIRSLGGLSFTVTISEQERDSAKVTDYPVESGATMSDHVIIAPRQLTVQIGQGVENSDTDPRDMLGKIRELMTKREPFEVYTGKTYFKSMVITAISVKTDAANETVLSASITLREVTIAQTQAAAVPVIRQKQPKKTAVSVPRGTQQTQVVSTPQNENAQLSSVLTKAGIGGNYDNSELVQ